mmetsp:Transcript_8794/g.24169  ORF Transcript_8794/g.24169 Transcript_8794/m.24169 type:complete len:161 (-) Transcript_8794:850-1332(-)
MGRVCCGNRDGTRAGAHAPRATAARAAATGAGGAWRMPPFGRLGPRTNCRHTRPPAAHRVIAALPSAAALCGRRMAPALAARPPVEEAGLLRVPVAVGGRELEACVCALSLGKKNWAFVVASRSKPWPIVAPSTGCAGPMPRGPPNEGIRHLDDLPLRLT